MDASGTSLSAGPALTAADESRNQEPDRSKLDNANAPSVHDTSLNGHALAANSRVVKTSGQTQQTPRIRAHDNPSTSFGYGDALHNSSLRNSSASSLGQTRASAHGSLHSLRTNESEVDVITQAESVCSAVLTPAEKHTQDEVREFLQMDRSDTKTLNSINGKREPLGRCLIKNSEPERTDSAKFIDSETENEKRLPTEPTSAYVDEFLQCQIEMGTPPSLRVVPAGVLVCGRPLKKYGPLGPSPKRSFPCYSGGR